MLYKFDIKFAPLWHGSCREMGLNSASHNHNDSTMENPGPAGVAYMLVMRLAVNAF